MFENIKNFCKRIIKREEKKPAQENSKNAAKERLHLVLMQDRANVSADFLELMKQEIIEVIKKYIEVDEKEIDVRLTNKENQDGTNGAPALYANIPILNIRNEAKKVIKEENKNQEKSEEKEESKNNINQNETEKKLEEKQNTVNKVEENKKEENKQEKETRKIEEAKKENKDIKEHNK